VPRAVRRALQPAASVAAQACVADEAPNSDRPADRAG
jgi:hypothetical protein